MNNATVCKDTRPDINLLSSEHLSNPFPTYASMRAHYPVCQVEPNDYWAVSRFDDVRFVLKNHTVFSTAYGKMFQADWLKEECKSDRFIAGMNPPQHTKYRSLVDKAFSGRIINALIPFLRETAQSLIPELKQKEPVDFLEAFAIPYTTKIIGDIIGTGDSQSLAGLRRWMELDEQITPARPDDKFIAEYEALICRQNAHFLEVVRSRRKHPQNDLSTALVNAEVNGEGLTDRMLCDVLMLLFASGYQTLTQVLCRAMIQLARQPDLLKTLNSSPDLIPAFIEELLRFDPPLHNALRLTTCAVSVAGVTIPEDALVLVMIAAANRDTLRFADPDTFDIHRRDIKHHIAFGLGPHTCIGKTLARLEVNIALETLLANFTSITCPPDDELIWDKSVLLRGLTELSVKFQ